MLQLLNLQWEFFWTFCARTEAGRICILSCRHVPYQARSLSTSDTSHDVSFHSMHKIMCLVVCRRSLIDIIAVMKENLLRFRTWAFWCEVYFDLAAYSVSLWFACQFLTSCTLQTLCWLRRRKWWRREQCEPKMDLILCGVFMQSEALRSSASDCIKTPHRHSHTETERQHTPNQIPPMK